MAFDGNGNFIRVYSWQTDKANGIKIRADRMDGEDDGFATGLSQCVTRDGQSPATANLPMGGFKHTNVAIASARTDYLRASQAQDNDLTTFITAGSADAYTLTPSPAVTTLVRGLAFFVRIHAVNATATPTLNISGLGAATIANGDLSALAPGDLAEGGMYQVVYQGTAGFTLPNKVQIAVGAVTGALAGTVGSGTTNMDAGNRYRITQAGYANLPVLTEDGYVIVEFAVGAGVTGTVGRNTQTIDGASEDDTYTGDGASGPVIRYSYDSSGAVISRLIERIPA